MTTMNKQEYAKLFADVSKLFRQAIIDRLAEIAKQNGGVYLASTPVLRQQAFLAMREVLDAESGITPLMAVDLWAGVMGANDSAFTQALEREARAGTLPFKVSRGATARVSSMALSYTEE